jgi:NAD(P)-dependent dehydrogenase (short-subunit alcohol dehydrogenase family)
MKKVALVTGGCRGIGLGISKALAREGYDLAVNGVKPESEVAAPLEELRALGTDVIYCQGDIGEETARTETLEKIKKHFGQLNVLVNNAGVAPRQRNDLLEAEQSDFEWLLNINLTGPYFLSQAVAKWMIAQKTKDASIPCCITNVGSISATVVSPNRGEYCVSKAGMRMMTLLFAARLGEYDIPVYEIAPGLTLSDMTSGVKAKYDKVIEDGATIQKRWGTPDDCGKAVAMLARGDCPYSTGQVIMIDGGLTTQVL